MEKRGVPNGGRRAGGGGGDWIGGGGGRGVKRKEGGFTGLGLLSQSRGCDRSGHSNHSLLSPVGYRNIVRRGNNYRAGCFSPDPVHQYTTVSAGRSNLFFPSRPVCPAPKGWRDHCC